MDWSQAVDSRLSPAKTTAKVNFKLHNYYLHKIGGRVSPRATLGGSLPLTLPLTLPNLHFKYPVREPLTMPTEIHISTQKRREGK